MNKVFAPGCALMLYKPESADKLHALLNSNLGEMDRFMVCCHHDPQLSLKTEIINICPGCDKRFGKDYPMTTTVSLWEILAESDFFPFPDYHGAPMTILDACPTREQEKIHIAIRKLLARMNISLTEPKNTGRKGSCCGDSFYGILPVEKVMEQMVKRASEMPLEEVVVYCVSCIKSIHIGGKKPRYLIDLLLDEETDPQTFEPHAWHKELEDYMAIH